MTIAKADIITEVNDRLTLALSGTDLDNTILRAIVELETGG